LVSISELKKVLSDFYCESELSRAKSVLLDGNNPWFIEDLARLCVCEKDGNSFVKDSLLGCDPSCEPKERWCVDVLILMEEVLNAQWLVTFTSRDHTKVPSLPSPMNVSFDKLCQTVEDIREETKRAISKQNKTDSIINKPAQPIKVTPLPLPATFYVVKSVLQDHLEVMRGQVYARLQPKPQNHILIMRVNESLLRSE